MPGVGEYNYSAELDDNDYDYRPPSRAASNYELSTSGRPPATAGYRYVGHELSRAYFAVETALSLSIKQFRFHY